MSAAEFTDHNDNRITLGTDHWVIIELPGGNELTVYRSGKVVCDNGEEYKFLSDQRNG